MTDPDSHEESIAVLARQFGVDTRRVVWLVHPQVQDPGGYDRRRRRCEKIADGAEHVTADVGDPQH